MQRDDIIAKLRAHEPELRAAGVETLALFGSFARGDNDQGSDVDIFMRLEERVYRGGFAYFGQLDTLIRRLSDILGKPVDIVAEPIQKERLRREIEEDRIVAF